MSLMCQEWTLKSDRKLSKRSRSITSFPLVSPLSNHSTVTLFVSTLIPETTAEWIRPGEEEVMEEESGEVLRPGIVVSVISGF